MTKNFKILILIFLAAIIIMLEPKQNDEELETYYIHGQYAFDVEDPYKVIGFGDYAFVARVEEKIGTRYEYNEVSTRWHVYRRHGLPYTQYSITVVENIKGDIEMNIPIILEQFGGISLRRKNIMLFEGDEILEKGSFYIIIANSQKDGSLHMFSPRGYKKMMIENESEIIDSEEYKEFLEYYENEIPFDRERYKSKYSE